MKMKDESRTKTVFVRAVLAVVLVSTVVLGGTGTRKMSSRVVNTKYGSVRGLIQGFPSNRHLPSVELFLGVPYASPPTGFLRFMPPVALTPWRGIRTADRFSQVCPQKFPDVSNETRALQKMPLGRLRFLQRLLPFLRNQSEDCLYLNIYVPAKVGREPSRLPVLVYIHGESFEWNAGNPYDGSVLASFGNVVVVTFNFRLGVFGFLSTDGEIMRGNYGLLDQIAALHWIEENIDGFGGDPHNVTIFGQGHGAALVNFLMVSPVAKGLFHRAILQSGSALSGWALSKDPLRATSYLANALGCPTSSEQATVECLRDQPVEAIQRIELTGPEYLTALGPTVDGVVVPTSPERGMRAFINQYGRYDLLFGVTKFETHVPFDADDYQFGFEADKRDRILRTFVANSYQYHLREIFALLVNEYTDWTKPVLHPINIRDATMEVLGDAQVVAPLVEAASFHSSMQLNTYFYNFGYQSRDGDYTQRLGCIHGEEMPYVFGAPLVDGLAHFHRNYTKAERMLSEAVMRYWTNFAKSGDPNSPEKQTSLHGGKNKNRFVKLNWPPYEMVHQKYLSIGMRPKVRHHYRAHKLSIWTQLIPEIHTGGGEGSGSNHHLFDGHDDPSTFEGTVRQRNPDDMSSRRLDAPQLMPPPLRSNITVGGGGGGRQQYELPTPPSRIEPPRRQPEVTPYDHHAASKNGSEPLRVEAIAPGGYSTALSVTIAVGCSLLILNVLIFAGVYYQRDKNRLEAKLQKRGIKPPPPSHHGRGGPDDHHQPPQAQVAPVHRSPPPQLQPPTLAPVAPPPSPVGGEKGHPPPPSLENATPESQPLLQRGGLGGGGGGGGRNTPRMAEIRV